MQSLINFFASPLTDWVVFFIMSFAFAGLGVKFYSIFDTSNYTYYQPDPNNPYKKGHLITGEVLKITPKKTKRAKINKKKKK